MKLSTGVNRMPDESAGVHTNVNKNNDFINFTFS
jgi:hypothetical protein